MSKSHRSLSLRMMVTFTILMAPGLTYGQWAPEPGTTVRNNFGPLIGDSATDCRGSCGGGCHPANCEPGSYWECVGASRFRIVRTFECGTHEGCRAHDDCLDECALRYPGDGRELGDLDDWKPIDRNFFIGECSRYCHAEAVADFGLEKTISWARGRGPFDGSNVFEYTKNAPGADEPLYRCPNGTKMVCEGGRARCEKDDEPEEPEEDPEDPATVVGVAIAGTEMCNDPEEPLLLEASAIGLDSPRVRWSVLSGPGSIDTASGNLTPQGEGTVVVAAVSQSDPFYRDEAAVEFGRCACSFNASLSGDTNRGTANGVTALFSTRGQASILGAAGGGPEYWEDLANMARLAGNLKAALGQDGVAEPSQSDLAFVQQMAENSRQATPGSTLGISLVEGDANNPAPGGLGGAFKVDLQANGTVAPGFSGSLPIKHAAVHTGEFAQDGGAPMLYLYDTESDDYPGELTLVVHEYDGQWMRGVISGNLTGIATIGERRSRLSFSANFTAGIHNPLRMENACLMALAFDE